jgi:hypothetical protein
MSLVDDDSSLLKYHHYDIWAEGYAVTGNSGTAQKMAGGVRATSFKNACIKHFEGSPFFDKEKLTYWGCKLFPDEYDARKTFG